MGNTYSDSSLLQADIVAGTFTFNNTAASLPVVTVPAGRTLRCSITLTICDTAVAATTFSTISALTAGVGVVPTAGTVLLIAQTHPGADMAHITTVTAQDVVVRAPAANAVSINGQLSGAATTLNGTCSVTGILIG